MNSIDLLIIYFSIGAPLGVYSYFQSHSEKNRNISLLKTISTFLFWIPAATDLIRSGILFRKQRRNADRFQEIEETRLAAAKKKLEKNFQNLCFSGSIYEFREVIERYAGLTAACVAYESAESEPASEFFKIAENKNRKTATKCLNRRNRERLSFHQTAARKDFLRVAEKLFAASSDKQDLVASILEFIDLLEDAEARDKIKTAVAENFLTEKPFSEKTLETDLWKLETRRLPNVDSISTRL